MYFALIVVLVTTASTSAYECNENEEECEITLTITHEITMYHADQGPVYPYQGKLYEYDVRNTSNAIPVSEHNVIITDGYEKPRLVVVANKTLPGPDIIVYENQRLKIKVLNQLRSDTVTIHWHGLPQKGTPWMDGTSFITQCPILPGQHFIYDFIARPKGTFWYHSHSGPQRAKGLFGSLIIREKNTDQNMPEHILQIMGWNHEWNADRDHANVFKIMVENGKKWQNSYSVNGIEFTPLNIDSVLINGRGRYHNPVSGLHNDPPLTIFNVEKGSKYRFRIISAEAVYPYRVSIDNHKIELVASDGFNLKPVVADAVIINPGERYDIILDANQTVDNYWIRAKSMEIDKYHVGEAILRYQGAEDKTPTTNQTECTSNNRCTDLNCPFSIYPRSYYTDCITFDKFLSATNDDPAPEPEGKTQLQEHFLNFRMLPSINGIKMVMPSVSALTQPFEIDNQCETANCRDGDDCKCTHSLVLDANNTVQFTFTNMPGGPDHPIHMHGYSFYVLKMGFADQNEIFGNVTKSNSDISCDNANTCNNATWKNPTWLGGNVPGLNKMNAPRKDTIIVPSGGYVVLRIKVDNPGVWYMHCHIDIHDLEGMAMYLNASYAYHPKPPAGFPTCNSFLSSHRDASFTTTPKDNTETTTTASTPLNVDCSKTEETFKWVIAGVIFTSIILLVVIIMLVIICVRNYSERTFVINESKGTGNSGFQMQ